MIKPTLLLTVATLTAACTSPALAQQEPPAGPPQVAPGGPPPSRGFGGPIMVAIDADQDGELSAEEINNATAALRKLDTNNDGKVDRTELRPQGRPAAGAPPAGNRNNFAARIMALDINKDGKVTKDEMPERMQRIVARADTNNDGAIDQAEAEALNQQLRGPDARQRTIPPTGNP